MAVKQQTQIAAAILVLSCLFLNSPASAEDGTWQVSKSSGDVWITKTAAQKVSLTAGTSH